MDHELCTLSGFLISISSHRRVVAFPGLGASLSIELLIGARARVVDGGLRARWQKSNT